MTPDFHGSGVGANSALKRAFQVEVDFARGATLDAVAACDANPLAFEGFGRMFVQLQATLAEGARRRLGPCVDLDRRRDADRTVGRSPLLEVRQLFEVVPDLLCSAFFRSA